MRDLSHKASSLDFLLARLVEETITPGELDELERILHGNPVAQRRYVHYLGLHAGLRELGSLPTVVPARSQRKRRWSGAALMGAAAAAAALVVAVIILFQLDPEAPPRLQAQAPIARLVELNGSVAWTGDGGQMIDDLGVGDLLGGGTLEVLAANSWAEFEFLDGSRVTVSGHSVLTLSQGEQGKLIRLRRGDLSVDATPQPDGRPLRVITPSAEAEVLGTQFNVTADPYSTRLTVNHGLVRVKRLADGSVQAVPADHLVVAALEQQTDFKAVQRRESAEVWKSRLPKGIGYGKWVPGHGDEPGRLRAQPLLWKKDRKVPLLLHTAVVNPPRGDAPPIRLSEETRFRIRGRIASSHKVLFGMTTHHFSGGFSGKFETNREIEVSDSQNAAFDFQLPLEEFSPLKDVFPESPVGLEIFDFWIQTLTEDAGLEIESVEILKGE